MALIKKAAQNQGIEALTYKRNRGVAIIKTASAKLAAREWGHNEESWPVHEKALAKLLKTLLKKKFPRSRQLRIYQLITPEDLGKPHQKI
jgi:hypothetical protein